MLRLELVSDVVRAVGRSRKGVQFDALDGKPVRLVLLFLVPQGQFQKHLHTLSNLAKLHAQSGFPQGRFRFIDFYNMGNSAISVTLSPWLKRKTSRARRDEAARLATGLEPADPRPRR